MFRVVPDQLKLSGGWVRCGHCTDVFDANLYLEPWVAPGAESLKRTTEEPKQDTEPPTPNMDRVVRSAARSVTATPGQARTDGLAGPRAAPRPESIPGDKVVMASGTPLGGVVQPPAAVKVAKASEPSAIEANDRVLATPSFVQRVSLGASAKPSAPAAPTFVPAPTPAPVPAAPPPAPPPSRWQPEAQVFAPPAPPATKSPVPVTAPSDAAAIARSKVSDTSAAMDAKRKLLADAAEARRSKNRGSVPIQAPDAPLAEPPAVAPEASTPVARSNTARHDGEDPQDFYTAQEREPHNSNFHADLHRFAQSPPLQPGPPDPDSMPAELYEALVDRSGDAHETRELRDDLFEELIAHEQEEARQVVPSFVQTARREAYWSQPAMRAWLVLGVLLLSALLVGQWAVHDRDRIAAQHPQWAGWVNGLCSAVGCTVGPVKRIDAVVIDSSTLVRRLGDFYSFDLVLKNTAAIPVAVPALELSLTDIADKVVARRIFLPAELPQAPTVLAASGQLSVNLRLSIALSDDVPMAGYRALVFYP